MSILLDAVVKQKQQQAGDLHDAVLTPRISTPIKANNGILAKLGFLSVSIAVAIGCAWGLNQLLSHSADNVADVKPAKVVNRNDKIEPESANSAQVGASQAEFSLAGKVALPMPKPHHKSLNVAESQTQRSQNKPASIQPTTAQQSQQSPNLNGSEQPNDSGLSMAQLQLLSQQYDQQLQSAYQQEKIAKQVEPATEQIILGANANKRGLRELESLRLQVNMAANEVDFNSVKQQETQSDNNLTAAFAAALKEVEYQQSASSDVTPDALSPITKPKPQGVPKYGDLPASVQLNVPEFNISAHVYSTDPNNRWLNVDGEELQQGDMIQGKLTIIEIRPRDVILDIDGQEFKVPAI